MKRSFLLAALSMLVLAFVIGCSNNESGDSEKKEGSEAGTVIHVVETIVEGDEAKTVASIGIEGMSCQVMCANSIKKAVAALQGVLSCEVIFDDKLATVEYDNSVITEDQLIAKIEGLQDGKYSISRVDIERTVLAEEDMEEEGLGREYEETETEQEVVEKVSTTEFNIPNIFDIFTRLYSY